MVSRKRKRGESAPSYLGEDEEKQALEQDEAVEETEDIYNEKQMDEMLKDGEISAGEYGFMAGREVSDRKKKRILVKEHEDTPSVELAKDDANEAD
jgi:hypothetical protein